MDSFRFPFCGETSSFLEAGLLQDSTSLDTLFENMSVSWLKCSHVQPVARVLLEEPQLPALVRDWCIFVVLLREEHDVVSDEKCIKKMEFPIIVLHSYHHQ